MDQRTELIFSFFIFHFKLKRLFLCNHKKSLFTDDASDCAYTYFSEAIKASFLSLCTICFL